LHLDTPDDSLTKRLRPGDLRRVLRWYAAASFPEEATR
jgi:hypothetical protein